MSIRPRRAYAPRVSAQDRREQILDAALALTNELPVGALTMEGIAEAARVTKPVVYSVFPNADAVVDALLEREQERAFQYVMDVLPSQDASLEDPVAVAFAGAKAFYASVLAHPETWRLLLTRDTLPAQARSRYQEAEDQILSILVTLCEWASSERRGGLIDPELYARLLLAGLEAGALRVLADPRIYTEERMLSFTAEVLRALQHG